MEETAVSTILCFSSPDSEFGVMYFLCPELLMSHLSGSSCGCKGLHVVLTALRPRPFEVEGEFLGAAVRATARSALQLF